MKTTVISVLLAIPLLAAAVWPLTTPAQTGCFEQHIREAMDLNRARRPLYSQITQGRSEKVSRTVIFEEALALPLARWLDWRARKFNKAGVKVLCDDFVSMELVPKFQPNIPAPPLSTYKPVDVDAWVKEIRAADHARGFEGMAEVLEAKVSELSATPNYHCMLRHLLESLLRVSKMAPRYREAALKLGMDSPDAIERDFIRIHLLSLGQAASVDEMAAPLQAEGAAIVCQDVPPIAVP